MLSFVPKVARKYQVVDLPVTLKNRDEIFSGRVSNRGEVPIGKVKPVLPQAGFWPRTLALLSFLCRTEVHTYAFSVAANVILSLFPFIVLLLTITRRVFHSRSMEVLLGGLMKSFLPTGQDFVMRNMQTLAHPRKGTQIVSLLMLLVTSTGVFLPLEVALNKVWGVEKNRSYLHNQAVSLLLAFSVGVLALASVSMTADHPGALMWIFRGHTQNVLFNFVATGGTRMVALLSSICLFFLIYWVLPNRKVPALAVLPTAITIGVLWEVAKHLYIRALPWLDLPSVYGPFYISVGLMLWAFLSGLLLLAGAHFSATRYSLHLARQAEAESLT